MPINLLLFELECCEKKTYVNMLCFRMFLFLGEGGLQSLLGNMSHNQLMQLIGPTGLGGLGKML